MAHLVTGALKDYDWGIVDGLARWHGHTGAAQAELWFGTHPSGPTIVVAGPDEGTVLADLAEHRGMPLLKLIAASTPLSLQVHPDAERARRGWESGSTLYADAAEKSEMLVALSGFDIHAGWRDPVSAADVLAFAGAPEDIVGLVRSGQRAAAIRRILDLTPSECASVEPRLVAAATTVGWDSGAVSALARVAATHPADPGVLVTVLLGHDVLLPGEGLAVTAGVIHSYVAGLGVEIMTTSDNVLRLGLTTKPVAIDDALSALRDDREPMLLRVADGQRLAPEGMPFDLVLADSPLRLASGRHRIVLPLHGPVRAQESTGVSWLIDVGRACVWSPGEPDIVVEPDDTAVVVTGADQLPG